MRLLLSIDTIQSVERETPRESIHEAPAYANAPGDSTEERLDEDFGRGAPAGDEERGISDMLALLDTLPATSSAEAFAALRRAFPHTGLGARVEAVKKRRALPREG